MKISQVDDSPYLSKSEAAAYLRLSLRSIDNLVARGELVAYKPVKKLLFRRNDLDRWVQSHRVGQDLDAIVSETLVELGFGK